MPTSQESKDVKYQCWYFPPGFHTIFGAKKGQVSISQGSLTVTDASTGEIIYSHKLYPDIQLRSLNGEVMIRFMNGKNNKALDYQYLFYFYNPKLVLLRFFLTSATNTANTFMESLKQAAKA